MIPFTLAYTLQRSQRIMGGCRFVFSFMVDWITAVGREVDYHQALGHFEQRLVIDMETAVS